MPTTILTDLFLLLRKITITTTMTITAINDRVTPTPTPTELRLAEDVGVVLSSPMP